MKFPQLPSDVMGMSDLLHHNLNPTQSDKQPSPSTIASAATITPTSHLTIITGTVQVATIVPPVTGAHQLCLIFTNAAPGATLTTGNIANALTPVTNIPVIAQYNPTTSKYHLK